MNPGSGSIGILGGPFSPTHGKARVGAEFPNRRADGPRHGSALSGHGRPAQCVELTTANA